MFEKKQINYLEILLGLFLLGLLFYWVPLAKVYTILKNIRLLPMGLALALTTVNFMISALKLTLALNAQNNSLPFFTVYRAYYIGSFFNNFIPTSIGGDIVKTVQLNKSSEGNIFTSSLAVIMERSTGVMALGCLGVLFILWRPEYFHQVGISFASQGRNWSLLALLSLLLLLPAHYYISSHQEEENTLQQKIKTIYSYPFKNPGLTLILLLLSFSFHFLRGLNYLLVILATGYYLNFVKVVFILPIIAFASFLPISMGGIGLREGIITFCLAGFGLPLETGLAVSLILRLFSIIHSSLGGLIYIFTPITATKTVNKNP